MCRLRYMLIALDACYIKRPIGAPQIVSSNDMFGIYNGLRWCRGYQGYQCQPAEYGDATTISYGQ